MAPRSGQAYEDAKAEKRLKGKQEAASQEQLRLSLKELRHFDGTNGNRILVSLQGKIIDVSDGAESYGPGGSYHIFAGRDVTKCLALMDLSDEHLDQPDYVPE